jgi:hypothetical protein
MCIPYTGVYGVVHLKVIAHLLLWGVLCCGCWETSDEQYTPAFFRIHRTYVASLMAGNKTDG